MEDKKFKNRIGEKHNTNEGYTIEIIECFSSVDCTIKFEDKIIAKNKIYGNIVKGKISNPIHKSVHGVGYLGIGKYNNKNHPKIYQTWRSMLARCYDKKYQEKQPSYIGCSAIKEWYNFQNFAKWYEENQKENCSLDKDILVKGNKLYSPETCCFVPQEVNMVLVKRDVKRGECPIGVSKVGDKFRASLRTNGKNVHLGYLTTPELAFQAYKTAKENQIKCVANEWKHLITEPTYQALINYQVKITD